MPWKVKCRDPKSPYANLSGVETFCDGEETSHIHITVPQEPRDVTKDKFDVILEEPRPPVAMVARSNRFAVFVNFAQVFNLSANFMQVLTNINY